MANTMLSEFDTTKFFLGRLCPRKHQYEGTERSLRYVSKRCCVQCNREYDHQRLANPDIKKKRSEYIKQYQIENKEKIAARVKNKRLEDLEYTRRKRRDWYQKSKHKRKEYVSIYMKSYYRRVRTKPEYREKEKAYRKSNRERIRERNRRYRELNREELRIKKRVYRKSYKGKMMLRRRHNRRRTLLKVGIRYTTQQMISQFQSFDGCAYCGTKINILDGSTFNIDHFIPVSKGGLDVLSNIVPSCSKCNRSKSNLDPIEWYQRQPFYSEKKMNKITKVLGKDILNRQLSFI